jgi:aerobic carbon-monoxide dehydrogenase medium subunit
VKPAVFDHVRPATVDEALALLAEHGDDGKVLSGGQSLVPLLNMRLALPTVVIDVSRIRELLGSTELPGGVVRYGAGTTHAAFEDRLVPDPTGGLLHHVAAGIGYRAIRNRGTLGGSLAHADASAEWPVVMSAVGATIVVRSARGERRIPASDLVQGFFTSAIEPDELLVAVEVPPLRAGTRWGFHKHARKPGEFAESLAAAVVGDTSGEVWLGAAREVPVQVPLPSLARDAVQAAVAGALAGLSGEDEGEVRYRRHLHGMAAWYAVTHAKERG